MKYDVEHLLEQAYCKAYFDDTDTRRVYEASLYKAAVQKSKRKRGLVPAFATALAVVLVVTMVPPVRAAVANFFESVGTYMSAAPEERPAVAGAIVQTPETGEQKTETGTENWVDGIRVHIDEAMFDGEKLYLNYTVTDPNRVLTPEEKQKSTQEMEVGETAHSRVFSTDVALENGMEMTNLYDYRADYENGVFHMTTMFSLGEEGGSLFGKQNVILKLNFANKYVTVESKNNGSVWAEDVGSISLPFTIETNAEVRTVTIGETFPFAGTVISTHHQSFEDGRASLYTNRPLALDGATLAFSEVKIKSTEIVLRMEIVPPVGMDYADATDVFLSMGYLVYADGKLMPDAYVDYTEADEAEKTFKTLFTVPFPPKDVRELRLVPCVSYTSSLDGKRVPTDGTFEFPESSGSQQTEQLLEQSAIVIDLTK